jgi:precorrin-2 dehydrogenase/sirohydrochlorin ferrochelatase
MQRKNSRKSNHRAIPVLTLPPRGGGRGGGETHSYYPAFLNLQGERVVVVGGGKIAERKILALLKTGALITVISPEITKRIAREKLRGSLKHVPRQYRKGDVSNTFLVVAATDSEEINKKVSEEAPCLVNVVDIPSLCNFIVPSVKRPVNYCTNRWYQPALFKIRKELEGLYGLNLSIWVLEKSGKERERSLRKKRTHFWKSLASEEIVKMLREKGVKTVKKVVLLSAGGLKT